MEQNFIKYTLICEVVLKGKKTIILQQTEQKRLDIIKITKKERELMFMVTV